MQNDTSLSMRRCNRTWFLLLSWGGRGGIRTSFILHACPKHCYLQRFRLFVQHTAQGCGRRKSVTSVQPFATMPNTRPTKTVKVLKFGKCVFGNASLQKTQLQRLSWQKCMKTSQITVSAARAHSKAVRLASRLHTQQRKSPRALKAPTTKRPENIAKIQRFAETTYEITPF